MDSTDKEFYDAAIREWNKKILSGIWTESDKVQKNLITLSP